MIFIIEQRKHNLTHRNINPDNIKVGNKWMLTDFATVKKIDRDPNLGSISDSSQARGTKGYLASEQHTGMATLKSDIYSIGMVGVHALRVHPRKLRKYNPRTGNKIWRDRICVSNCFGNVIERAINYNFGDCYQTATEML